MASTLISFVSSCLRGEPGKTLSTYPFPGNIRELQGMISDAVSRHTSGVLSMETFRDKIAATR